MSGDISFHDVIGQIESCELLACTDKAKSLAKLVAKINDSNASGALRVLVQATFCETLLKSLQPPTKSAAVLDTLSTHHQQHTPSQHPTQSPSSSHDRKRPSAATQTTAGGTELADAWTSASQALELIYAWEDETVVVSVISFWNQVSSLLCGVWLPYSQQEPTAISDSQDPSSSQQANSSAAAAHTPSSPINPSTAAAAAGPLQALSTPELQYLSWLWVLGPAAVAAVVQELHNFWRMTGINHLLHKHTQHHNKGPAHRHVINLLLLFLTLHNCSGPGRSSSSSKGGFSSSQPALQLLQLLYAGSASCDGPVAAVLTAAEAFSGVSCLLQVAAVLHITLPASTTAAAAAPSSQKQPPQHAAAVAVYEDTQPAGTQPDSRAEQGYTAWPQLAAAAGEWLRDSYGWCSFGEAANASPSAAAAAAQAARCTAAGFSSSASVARPSNLESLYDCFMIMLLQQIMQGPHVSSTSSDRVPARGGSTARQLHGSQAAAVGAAAQSDDDDWECWVSSLAFSALTALLATYDRPDVLARGLHILTQQQLAAAENTAAAAAVATVGAAGDSVGVQGLNSTSSQAAAKKADKSALGRALLLLERVFLWWQQQQSPVSELLDSSSITAAHGVCQLLLGLSELLRPAANCSVKWRCAALAAMQSAVEDFTQGHPGEDDLELQLWCDASVEGLLYCASQDPSIQARRAAVQLLQHVVLPNSSPTARAVIRCIVEKLSDKDSVVVSAALQLFVQLQPKVLCNCLTAAQWCTAVQAGLGMLYGTSSAAAATQSKRSGKGGRQQVRGIDTAVKRQFLALLQKVLQSSGSTDGQAQQQQQRQGDWQWLMAQGDRIVGVGGCRQVLMMLMMEPGLEGQWQVLAEGA